MKVKEFSFKTKDLNEVYKITPFGCDIDHVLLHDTNRKPMVEIEIIIRVKVEDYKDES